MKKVTRDRLLVVLVAIATAVAGFNWQAYTAWPTQQVLDISNPYAACVDQAGDYYVVDQGLSRLLKISGEGELLYQLHSQTNEDKGFFRVTALSAQGGRLYLADTTQEGVHRLLALDSATGEVLSTVYESDGGQIEAVRADERAYFAVTEGESTLLYRIEDMEPVLVSAYAHSGLYESEFAISTLDESLYFATMTGDVYHVTPEGPQLVYNGYVSLDDLEHGSLARWISVDESGLLLLSDTAARTVLALEDGRIEQRTETGEPLLERRIDSALYGTQGGFVALSSKQDEATHLIHRDAQGAVVADLTQARFTLGYQVQQWALWILAGAVAVAVLVKAAILLAGLRRREKRPKKEKGESGVLAVSLGSFALVVLVAIALVLLPSIRQSTNQMVMDNLSSLSYLAAQLPVGDAITRIRDIDDYQNEDYQYVESQLNQLLVSVKDSQLEYYYVLYTTDQVYGVTLIDSTGEYKMFQLQPRPHQGSDTQIYNYGQGIQMNYETYSDETGDWSFSVTPIRDSSGEVVAIIEVGVNSYTVRARNDATITGLLMTVLTLLVILFMTYNELEAFGGFLRARRAGDAGLAQARALRPLAFLSFVACSLQSAFVAILASRLYTPLWGLPQSVAVAIPVSASLLTTSVFGVVGGYMMNRLGVRRTLMLGCLIIAGSFAAIGLSLSFGMLILGRLVSGVGMGLSAVSLNALASAGQQEQVRSEAFTGYNTGMTAGVNIGTVLGSQLVGWLGYGNIYLLAALMLVGMTVFAALFVPKEVALRQRPCENGGIGTGRFLLDRKVWSFFLCVFLPYTVCSYFLYYFFPLYADMNGMGEADIGRFYLLAGLIVVGFGPGLTRFMMRTFGGFMTNAAANLLYAAVFLWFALSPSMAMAVVAVVLLSLFDSFGFSGQSIYYSGLSAVERLGTGKAMGIFSMVENIAQTAAPFLFGFALTLGAGLGVAAIGLSSVVLLPVYLVAGRKDKGGGHGSTVA